MKTLAEYQEAASRGYPWLPREETDRQGAHDYEAARYKATIDALCSASTDEAAARRVYILYVHQNSQSYGQQAARLMRFKNLLVSRRLLTREQLRQLEANDGNNIQAT